MDVIKLLELIQTHQQWVYGLLLAYTLAKTGPLPLVAGYVSGTGALEFGLVIAACSVGTLAGSNIRFFVGSLLSSRLFRWSPKAAPWIALGAVGVDRFGFWLLPLYRFSKGTFTLVGLGAGISMNHRRFVVLDAIGAALWVAAMVGVGRGLWLLWPAGKAGVGGLFRTLLDELRPVGDCGAWTSSEKISQPVCFGRA